MLCKVTQWDWKHWSLAFPLYSIALWLNENYLVVDTFPYVWICLVEVRVTWDDIYESLKTVKLYLKIKR